ncbi:TraR/DksA family transcriptional regulator [Altererythrobacter sp. Root672]|uniref:TraR/DksA family transcriptional regulator n=1 Tax=Altererythrobacter sp. Root672 TaxID=1736584 RepID=UPI00070101B5|nr:TraR/DksA family transcriptional regulator [Altererythrobacter sp. Root672]KRA82732.1 conjugal transfer protein TraR [Altererythrobacter sp. Root672]
MPDTAAAKSRLEAQLAELQGRLERIETDLAEPLNPDLPEQATEMQDDDSLGGQAELVARQIASTERALERIEDGSYGVCVQCGADIAEGRLEARPEAALCIECARGQ